MNSITKRLLVVIMACCIFLVALSGCGGDITPTPEPAMTPEELAEIAEQEAYDAFKKQFYTEYRNENFNSSDIVLTFAVISDIHMGLYKQDEKLQDSMNFLKSRLVNKLDAIMLAGDITNSYNASKDESQITITRDILLNTFSEHTAFFYCLGRGHDCGGYESSGVQKTGDEQRKKFYELFGERFRVGETQTYEETIEGYKHAVIGGYNFLAVDMFAGDYSNQSLKWLENKLKDITKAEPDKPVFVTTHVPVTASISKVLDKFPQVIHFSGHDHTPFNTQRAISQSKFTELYNGGMAYYRETNVDSLSVLDNGNNFEYSQGFLVEVDRNNNVRVLRYDMHYKDILDNSWVIPAPKEDGSHLELYTVERFRNGEKPVFPENATITFEFPQENIKDSVKISFPAAQSVDGMEISHYAINAVIKDGGGNQYTEKMTISSLLVKHPDGKGLPEVYTVEIPGVAPPYSYKVTVRAYACSGKASANLVAEVISEKYVDII